MRRRLFIALLAALLTGTGLINAQSQINAQDPAPAKDVLSDAERMAWWKQAKFGMFIHWGVYSKAGGEWNGETHHHEWLQFTAKIPLAEYTEFAKTFDPKDFDPDQWVTIAKNAGMKYMVITSKHHDGVTMYDSQSSDHNVVDLAGLEKEPIRQLAEACRKQGIRFGVYYSLGRDWEDPDVGFGPIDVLWFDTPEKISAPESEELFELARSLQPKCIVNGRVGNGFGDYGTPEQTIPPEVKKDSWETCMTLNGHWAYNKADEKWKSTGSLLRNLVDISSKGGNYLLNVGPTGDGIIPQPSVERLSAMGEWLKINGEAIYGCGPTPFGDELGSFSKTEKDKKGRRKFNAKKEWRATTQPGKLYLHLFKWPTGKAKLPAYEKQVAKAYFLSDSDKAELKFEQTSEGITIDVPDSAPDENVSVICLELQP